MSTIIWAPQSSQHPQRCRTQQPVETLNGQMSTIQLVEEFILVSTQALLAPIRPPYFLRLLLQLLVAITSWLPVQAIRWWRWHVLKVPT